MKKLIYIFILLLMSGAVLSFTTTISDEVSTLNLINITSAIFVNSSNNIRITLNGTEGSGVFTGDLNVSGTSYLNWNGSINYFTKTQSDTHYWNKSNDIDDDEIAEGKIAFSTACAAGNHYYLSGNDLACEADDDTTYTADEANVTLVGTVIHLLTLDLAEHTNSLAWITKAVSNLDNYFTKTQTTAMIDGNRTALRADIDNNASMLREDIDNNVTELNTIISNSNDSVKLELRDDIDNNVTLLNTIISNSNNSVKSELRDNIDKNITQQNSEKVNITTQFGGEVSGTFDNLVIGNDALDDQYYDSEGDLTALLDDNYVDVAGDTMTGSLVINGNFTVIGKILNATVDNQHLNGSFLPSLNNQFDIGSATLRWKDIYGNATWAKLAYNLSNTDFGDWTCAGGSCTLDTDSVGDNEIDYTEVTLADITDNVGYALDTELASNITDANNSQTSYTNAKVGAVGINVSTNNASVTTALASQDECSEITGCVENALINGTDAYLGRLNLSGNLYFKQNPVNISIIDAEVGSLKIVENGNEYMTFDTTNGEEDIEIHQDFKMSGIGLQDYLQTVTATSLTWQGLSSGVDSSYSYFSYDGNTTDGVSLNIFGNGTPDSVANREQLRIGWFPSSNTYNIYTEEQGSGTLRPLNIYTEGNSGQIYLNTDGNVGIGTTGPDGTLHVHTASAGAVTASEYADDLIVEGTGNSGISLLFPDTGYGRIYFGSPSNNDYAYIYSQYNANNGFMQFDFDGNPGVLRLQNNGNVGIGTTSPAHKLDITGSGKVSGDWNVSGIINGTFNSEAIQRADPPTNRTDADITSVVNVSLSYWEIITNTSYDLSCTDCLTGAEIAELADADISNTLTCSNLIAAGDVDIGSHKLTAETLESDVADGTAPLIVASRTQVINLNATFAQTAYNLTNADFGNFTCADGTCTLDTDSVGDNEIDYTEVTLADITNDENYIKNDSNAQLGRLNVSGNSYICDSNGADCHYWIVEAGNVLLKKV